MKLRQVIGRARSGKSAYCLSEVQSELLRQARGPALIYLVPEQMTFQMEQSLVNLEGISGVSRAQVFSFTRLAWRVLSEVGGMNRQHIDSTGVKMLIRKSIERHGAGLKVYGQIAKRAGFIAELEALFIEYKRHQVTLAKLEGLLASEGPPLSQLSRNKLEDIVLLFADFEAQLEGKYLLSEDYLELLIEKLPQSSYIRGARIYIDGFYSYSGQELALVQGLIQHAQEVTVTHVLDQAYHDGLPHILNFLRPSAMTYQAVRGLGRDLGADLEDIMLRADGDFAKNSHPSLNHLEANFNSYPIKAYQGETKVDIMAAVNRRVEVEAMGRQIISLVRDSNYRYRDIAIIVRNMGDYQPLFETILPDMGIPYFMDQKEPMLHHPLIELIRSSLDAILYDWNYESVFRLAKTGLVIRGSVGREWIDQLENYVLARGIRGRAKWTGGDNWSLVQIRDLEVEGSQSARDKDREESLNQTRRDLAQPLAALEDNLKEGRTGRDYALALYQYLDVLKLSEELDAWQEEADQAGRLIEARHHDQAWQAVMDILDQLVEILGEEDIDLESFAHIIDSGLEGLHFSLVPAAIEQVIIANLDHSRLSGVKAAFILGVNEGVIPAKHSQEGLLTDDERELLADLGLKMAPGYQIRMLEDTFAFYRALASPTDYLWVSQALADLEGKEILPSIMIKHLGQLLPQAGQGLLQAEASDVEDSAQLDYVTNPNITNSYLMNQLRHWRRAYPIPDFWWEVYNWYINLGQADEIENNKKKIWQKFDQALSALFYENQAEDLSEEVSLAIYGQDIQLSVSRLESYRACPFAYFAGSGLGLAERDIHKLGAPDIGNFYHAILSLMAKNLLQQGKSWSDLTITELGEMSSQEIDKVGPRVANAIFTSSQQMSYRLTSLDRVMKETLAILHAHESAGTFRQQGAELSFGYEGHDMTSLAGPLYELAPGRKMKLRGRIDRMDMSEDGKYLTLIDYKSSSQKLDASLVYDGLSLQLMTYLGVLLEAKNALPAGALYFHVHNARVRDDVRPQEIEREASEVDRYKSYRLDGLVINERDRLLQMDRNLAGDSTGKSEILPVDFKKDGEPTANSRVASQEDFQNLIKYTQDKSIEIGREIIQGRVKIRPYNHGGMTACTYCPYSALCQFEPGQAGTSYRWLEKVGNIRDLLERLGGGPNGDKVD